jgi:hypothetical protein
LRSMFCFAKPTETATPGGRAKLAARGSPLFQNSLENSKEQANNLACVVG